MLARKSVQTLAAAVSVWLSMLGPAGAAAPALQREPAATIAAAAARASADPRECLKFSTNVEVAVCAEKYRPKSRRR